MWLNRLSAVQAFQVAHAQRELLEGCAYDPLVVRGIQRAKLAALWERADRVPRYAADPAIRDRRFEDVGVLEKDELKADPTGFLATGVKGPIGYYESSGSSGRATPTPRTAEDTITNVIGVGSLWRTVLTGEPDRVAALLPSDVAPVGDFVAAVAEYLGHTFLRCYPFATGICDFDRLDRLFRGYRPTVVFGAPGVLTQWTRVLKTTGALADVTAGVRAVMLLGEVSLPGQRAKLAADWSAKVFDASYGSTETGTIAATCGDGGLHLLESGHLVELRRGDKLVPAAPGESGELVTTTLNNHARPLLRFATGDAADILPDLCRCGLGLPLLRVHGRRAEQVTVGGVQLDEHGVGALVYDDPRLTGYLIQLDAHGGARLVVEKDVDVTGPDGELTEQVSRRFADAGITWTDVVAVSQLPPVSKAGGSQKNWKRTNVVRAR
ncbi:phenylacetate--CoA ligase family protein [Amycolatopsis sp. DG1A-15b]|uniref:phenylacetate--CoA ligase family protein n=1 Tax=Amycolatopsis sp. DG1A-15b TaxID=3052846 RepID=UPI00255C1F5E|nr:phenylacetate--CoA ligase family protein [Amycolatopsis sp. DG1A-15b]WIX91449.1 phenylacetate--CoA ligase family protein [Amycolatopsis sp. DG1A-15b]